MPTISVVRVTQTGRYNVSVTGTQPTTIRASGTNTTLNDVTDVTITSVTDNEVLAYNAATSKFINQTAAEAGLSAVGHTHTASDITDLTESAQDIVGAMFSGNTETRITVTYQDADGTIDLVVDDDLANYDNTNTGFISDITAESLSDLSDITISTIAANEVLQWNGSAWINRTLTELGIVAADISDFQSTVSTNTDVADNTSKAHTQGTDTGTTSDTFALDSDAGTYLLLKNSTGALHVRNQGDTDYADIVVNNLTVQGTTTTINTETVTIDDNIIVLNSNYAGSTPTENGGVEIERGTLTNASIIWDESNDVWKLGLAGSEIEVVDLSSTQTLTNKSGNISQWTNDSGYITATLTNEQVQDIVGAMLSGNTETLITVTYQDVDGTIDFVVNNDLSAYDNTTTAFISDITAESLQDLSNVTVTTLGANELLFTQDGSTWINQTLSEAGIQEVLSEGAFVNGDKTKLDGIESSADVTDEANVVSSLNGATLTAVTVSSSDKVLVQDADDADNLKTVTAQSIADLSSSSGFSVTSGAGAPASTPSSVGDIYIDTTNDFVYIATDTASSADWDLMTDTDATQTLTNKTINTASNTITIVSSDVSDFDEAAQDAVGTILVDSSEIDFTYTDATPSITASLVAGSIDETKLDASVNASLDLADSALQSGDNISLLTNDSGFITATLTQEQVEDYAGTMIATGGTKTLITVTYQDATNDIDFVVDNDLHNYSWTNVSAADLKTGSVTQAYDATLTSIAALGTAADKILYTTAIDTWAETGITAFGRSILDDADEATFKATVNLEIGTDVQAWDVDLDAIAALAKTDGNFIVGNGTTWVAESGATVRTSLGLGSIATQAANNVSITGGSISGITDLAVADGGTGASNAAGAKTNLGFMTDLSDDTTPTLGGPLDANGQNITGADKVDYDYATGLVSALGNLGSTEAIDWSSATHFTGTLNADVAITHSNEGTGQKITLFLSYDGTAQRTITWSNVDIWLDNNSGAAPASPSASGKVLVVTMFYDGTTCYASASGNYAVY